MTRRRLGAAVLSVAGIAVGVDAATNHVPTRVGRVAKAGAETFVDFKRNVPAKPDEVDADTSHAWKKLHEDYKTALRAYNLRTAERLLHVCKQNGGVFTKIGQQLASLNHALPVEYTSTLSVLQDQALPVSFEEAKSAVETELGGPLDQFFREFNTKPIAAASLAQVHHAVTQDGREVAVKIQYPKLAKTLASDLWAVRQAIYAIERIWDISVRWIIPEIEQALEAELDFSAEKQNSRKIQALFRSTPFVYIPTVYDELSTRRVLTMEFIHGVKVTNTNAITQKLRLDPVDIAGKVSAMFAEMVFCSGFVHCDPHPGNLFVRRHPHRPREAQIVLLDHGLYRQLDDDFRQTFCRLWKALLLRDNKLLMECGERFHVGPYTKFFPLIFTYRAMNSKTIMGGQMSAEEKQALRQDLKSLQGTNVNEFFEHLPRDMLFVFRSTNLTRSLNKDLGGNSRQRFQIFGMYALKGLSQDRAATGAALTPWQSFWWTVDYANLVFRLRLIDWGMYLHQKLNGISVDPDKSVG
ncbi:Atypical/ABC1 protein kinase, variant [Aphanomyces invadans]|uniref:Atypical/ABC1 protein kinase, variant n=1 Tax=Aphanomyces invadans TaxID=157072 RepID=A0A024URS1_9STRA|nr:Atypical/ABC1 protein kinase, variant [Aphanomyces invadans]ETW08547.1 Atypical/ABC1 protein kinase, variant [Aphanomyces invadans]|eukprot:XP_008862352.1 Atypical/ABC1 protein kinase, variant [Aphanomyces invadans]